MGKKQRDCIGCGAPVGFIGRDYCCRCMRLLREDAAKAQCPGCGNDRVLSGETGRCVVCSRRCTTCGGPVRARRAVQCRACRRRAAAQAAKAPCPKCGKPGLIRTETGWCGSCSRPSPPKDPPRICVVCGELRRHCGFGMCSRCWQREPDRPLVRGANLIAGLDEPPPWLPDFVGFLAARHGPARAAAMIGELGRLLTDEQGVERSCRPTARRRANHLQDATPRVSQWGRIRPSQAADPDPGGAESSRHPGAQSD